MTEPESGGHVLAMQGTARRRGGDYLLNGRKWFVGNSHISDVHGVVLRTGEGTRGLSAFLVESDRPGFRLHDTGTQSGLHGFSFGEIVFEDCRIPVANRLSEEGHGLMTARLVAYHAVDLLDHGLPCDAELINAKLVNAEYALDSARAAMEIFAARGLQTTYPIER